jgi:hypoxanthine phosphoribosyltransferase
MKIGDSYKYWKYADLIQEARELASRIAGNESISAIAGVPRSGMVAASAMAVQLGVPLCEASMEGVRSLSYGRRLENQPERPGRVLVVEDSINTGRRFRELQAKLGKDYLYASVFSTTAGAKQCHYVGVQIDLPHWFEWWFWGSKSAQINKIATDFDGILCEDCPPMKNYDCDKYRYWLRHVRPIVHASPHGVPYIITARLEDYRGATLEWMVKHRQVCGELVMGPWRSSSERARHCPGSWKASECKRLEIKTFIESCPKQAAVIHEAGVTVVCPELGRVLKSGK